VRIGRRRPPVPAEFAGELGLGPGDRVLAWSPLVGGGVAVATMADLRILTPRGRHLIHPWVDVDHAAWDRASRTLAVWWVGSRQTTPLEIEDDSGRLPEAIRERVQASVVLTAPVSLPAGRAGRVAIRRDAEGRLSTQSLLPPGVSATAPDVAPLLAAALAELGAEAGPVVQEGLGLDAGLGPTQQPDA